MSLPSGSLAVDSNVVIAVLRRRPEALAWVAGVSSMCVPLPVVAEVRFGAIKSPDAEAKLEALSALLTTAIVLALDPRTAEVQSDLRLKTERVGRPIPQNDLWIAACCLQHGLRLATRDAHLLELPGLDAFKPF